MKPENIMNDLSLAEFAAKHSFKDRVIPTDMSRKTLMFKDDAVAEEDDMVVKDSKGKKLAKKFFKSVNVRSDLIETTRKQILDELINRSEISDIEREDIINRMNHIIQVQKGVRQISKGEELERTREEHELKEEFIAKLCEVLTNP